MAEEGKLKKKQKDPDPEMIRNLQLFRKMELLQMMRDLQMVPKTPKREERKKP